MAQVCTVSRHRRLRVPPRGGSAPPWGRPGRRRRALRDRQGTSPRGISTAICCANVPIRSWRGDRGFEILRVRPDRARFALLRSALVARRSASGSITRHPRTTGSRLAFAKTVTYRRFDQRVRSRCPRRPCRLRPKAVGPPAPLSNLRRRAAGEDALDHGT